MHQRSTYRVSHGVDKTDLTSCASLKKEFSIIQHRRRKLTELHSTSPHVTLKASKLLSKRHPDTIDVRMKCDRTFKWIEAAFGLQLATSLANSPYHVSDEDHETAPTTVVSSEVTVEFSRRSKTERRLRVCPVSELTNFLELRPTLLAGEYVRVIVSSGNSLPADARDGMCHKETFFPSNAMNRRSTCPRLPKCSCLLDDITPMSKVRGKTRTIKFFCHKCTEIYESASEQGLQPCPIPDTILTANGFDPKTPILTAPLTSADFETYRRQRPTGREAG